MAEGLRRASGDVPWLTAALERAAPHELEDEVRAAYRERTARGMDDLEAALSALREYGIAEDPEDDDVE